MILFYEHMHFSIETLLILVRDQTRSNGPWELSLCSFKFVTFMAHEMPYLDWTIMLEES